MNTGSDIQVAVLLRTGVWPALAAVTVILGAWLTGRMARRDLAVSAAGIAFGAGVVAALLGARGVPHWPVADTLDWIGPLVVLAALVGAAAQAIPARGRAAFLVLWAGGLCLGAARLVMVPSGSDPSASWVWAALVLGVLWGATSVLRSSGAPGWFGAWAGASAGAAGLLGLSGSALLGQVMGAIAVVAGVLAVLGVRWGRVPAGTVGSLVLAYGGVLVYAWAFTEAPRGPLVMALAAPIASGTGRLFRGSLAAALVPTLVAVLVTGAAVLWARGMAPAPYTPY